MRTISPERWAGIIYSTGNIERFPIVPMTSDTAPIYATIAEKVRQILAISKKTNTTGVSQEILEADVDALVRKLYGVK